MRQLLPLLLLAGLPVVAQEDEGGRPAALYRIELIVFANRDPEAAASEAWPPEPNLAYPAHWQILGSGDTWQPADRPYRPKRVEDTVPEIFDLFWDRSIDDLWAEYRQKRLRQPDIELESLYTLDVPRPLTRLPEERRELNTQRRRIDNSAGLDVLFHESWLQPIRSEDESLPILFDTPERFGDYPELQGTILLYRGRYLHIATNLWLNTDGRYLDAPDSWQMPAPPRPPDPTEPSLQPFRVDPPHDWLESKPDALHGQQNTPGERPPAGTSPAAVSAPEQGPSSDASARGQKGTEAIPVGEFGAQHTPVSWMIPARSPARHAVEYAFRHAVVIRQQRRMRSDELHYIDHPMLGIVVKISQHEFEPWVTSAQEDPALAEMR